MLVAGFGSVIAVAIAAVAPERAVLRPLGQGRLDVFEARVLPLLTAPPAADRPTVVTLGDSLAICGEDTTSVARELPPLLATAGLVDVRGIEHLSLQPRLFYALLDDILDLHPRLTVIEINMRMFTEWSGADRVQLDRQVMQRLRWRRLLATPRLLLDADVSLLDPIYYRAAALADASYLVSGLRQFAFDGLEPLSTALTLRLGVSGFTPFVRSTERTWGTAAVHVLREYGSDHASHPFARLLRQMRSELRAGGSRVLFYVSPINKLRIEQTGVGGRLDLPARVDALRRAIDANPSEWLDLAAALPSDGFSDPINHMKPPGCAVVAKRIAERASGMLREPG